MIGPILHQELLLGSRRNRLHLFRWLYAAWLVVLVIYFYFELMVARHEQVNALVAAGHLPFLRPVSTPHIVGGRFAEAFVWQQMLLLVLATPTLVAGAITDEKRRGTLQYLLTAGVDTRELLLGKLLGRMAQVVLILLAGLPLFALLGGLGGVDPLTILLLAVQMTLSLFALASAALLASVLCRQTRDAVLALYLLGVLGWLAVWRLGGVLNYFNPLYVLAPVWDHSNHAESGVVLGRFVGSLLCWGLLGGGCLGLAIALLRPLYRRELESVAPFKRWYSAEHPPVQDDPIRWRESQIEGLSPSRALRTVPQWLAITLIAAITTISSVVILCLSLPPQTTGSAVGRALLSIDLARLTALLPDANRGFLVQGVVVLLVASLIVGVRCSGAVTGEREKQTWEALLLTPLSAKQLLQGKLWGVMGASYWYLLAYAAPAVVLAAFGGLLALWWTVLWLAVTVLAMYFVGSAGLYCSVRAKNSWRSLLATLGFGYLGGLVLFVITSPVIFVLAALLWVVVALFDLATGTNVASSAMTGFSLNWNLVFVAVCIGLAAIFLLASRLFLSWAQRWVADRERTRHWHEEPVFRRPRRPVLRTPSREKAR